MNVFYLIKPYFITNRWRIMIGLMSLISVDLLQVMIPRVVKRVVDILAGIHLPAGGRIVLWRYAALIVFLAVFIGVFRYIWRRFLIGLSRQVEAGLREKLFAHIQTLSAENLDRLPTGDIMARATNDINQVRMAAGMGLVALTDAVVLGAAAVCFMLYIHVKLTLFVLIPMPMIALTTRFFGKKMYRRSQKVQAAFADITENVREKLSGIRIIKAYHTEKAAAGSLARDSKIYVNRQIRLIRVTRSFFPLMILFSNFSLGIILFMGGRLTIAGAITPGDFIAFISYLGLLFWPVMALGWLTNLVQRGKASLERIAGILEIKPTILPARSGKTAPDGIPEIRFENVSFAYNAREPEASRSPAVLSGIDLVLPPNAVLGIAGPPGSGKTTLLALLSRLYDVTDGRILINGVDIREFDLLSLRRMFAYVPQEPFLFSSTISDNIAGYQARTGKENRQKIPERLSRKLETVLKQAWLTNTVTGLSGGIETVVGEKGAILSGGQKQRIALARALMRPAPVLILDDPVSQVDVKTGQTIIDAVREKSSGHTVILVSHRVSALNHADRIIVLEKGKIIENGTHKELMEKDGYYARAVHLQSGFLSENPIPGKTS